jgi:lipase ATG15
MTVYRPKDLFAVQHARRSSLSFQQCNPIEWQQVSIAAPDARDKATLGQLARMAGNAYALPDRSNWYELDPGWSMVRSTSSES